MTLRLILIRHAKSSWGDPAVADVDRKLNNRGQRSAALIGEWLASRGHAPDEVLCSAAVRTRQTWEGIAPFLPEPAAVRYEPALYHADPETMLAALRAATGRVVMMLGHNPGIAEFARRLLSAPPPHREFARFPTGATLVADFDAPGWQVLRPGSGRTVDFVVPRELEG